MATAPAKPPAKGPAKASGGKAAKRGRTKREARAAELEQAIVGELDQLRTFVHQIGARFLERLESETVQIREAVEAGRGAPDRLSHLSLMLEALRAVRVKPDKGRLKDLKRVDELIVLLNRISQKLQ